jgi:hypothetical protein
MLAVLAATVLTVATGCHAPGGAMMRRSGGSITYYSTEVEPISIRMIDLRNHEVIFSMDIPAGKQLTLDFLPEKGDDPALRPDLMRYDVWDIGTRTGRLRNSLTVPTASSRRIDVFYREGPEFMEAPPDQQLRSDELAERPPWWTPQGGPLPTTPDNGVANYDG